MSHIWKLRYGIFYTALVGEVLSETVLCDYCFRCLDSKESPLYRIGYNETMVALFKDAIRTAQRQEKHFQQLLAGIVNYMHGLIFTIDENKKLKDGRFHEIVEKSRQYMHENIENISYSTFRHIFKQYTGIAPSQYYLNLKIQIFCILILPSILRNCSN